MPHSFEPSNSAHLDRDRAWQRAYEEAEKDEDGEITPDDSRLFAALPPTSMSLFMCETPTIFEDAYRNVRSWFSVAAHAASSCRHNWNRAC